GMMRLLGRSTVSACSVCSSCRQYSLSQRALQLASLLLAFALREPLAWQAHLLVALPERMVCWGYSVPQGRMVLRERSELRAHLEHLVWQVQRMRAPTALRVVLEQMVLVAHWVRRGRLSPY